MACFIRTITAISTTITWDRLYKISGTMNSLLFLFYISPLSQLKSHYHQFPRGTFASQMSNSTQLETQPDTKRLQLHQDHVELEGVNGGGSRTDYSGAVETIRVWTGNRGQSMSSGSIMLGTRGECWWEGETWHIGRVRSSSRRRTTCQTFLESHSPWSPWKAPVLEGTRKFGESSEDSHKDNELVVH